MEQFVRVGDIVVNLDQVTYLEQATHYEKPVVRVHFVGDDYVVFRGEERDVLLRFMSAQESLEDMLKPEQDEKKGATLIDEPLCVEHVRLRPDDKDDLFALGIATAGPDDDLTVFFPDGTIERSGYTFPNGSVACVESGELVLAVRTW